MLCVMTAIYAAPLFWSRLAAAAALLWPMCPAVDPSDPVMQVSTLYRFCFVICLLQLGQQWVPYLIQLQVLG